MSGPTLLQKGRLRSSDGSEEKTKELSNIVPMDYILDYIKTSPVKALILKSETGSGKSVSLPPNIYKSFPSEKSIAVTEPTTLIATDTPRQIRDNHAVFPYMKYGENLGFRTGALRMMIPRGLIYMTAGSLNAEFKTATDEELVKRYSFILIDEVHQASLELINLLFLIKQFMSRNKDIFFIFMSATLDHELLMRYFSLDITNVIMVEGQTYAKTTHWPAKNYENYIIGAVSRVKEINDELGVDDDPYHGDVLIFLPGVAEFRAVTKLLDEYNEETKDKIKVFAVDSASQQKGSPEVKEALDPTNIKKLSVVIKGKKYTPRRKVVLSTVIAETGVTIDTLKYIIDNGYNKSTEYNPHIPASGLLVMPAAQTRIIQRKGRVGRKFPGDFLPLYTEETFKALPFQQFSDLTVNDATKILLSLFKNQLDFNLNTHLDLVTPIPPDSLQRSLINLYKLGFISITDLVGNSKYSITPTGAIANILDCNVNSAKMILAGYFWDCSISDLCSIASGLDMDERGLFDKESPTKWDMIYESALPKYIHPDRNKIRFLIGCDFIDLLMIFYASRAVLVAKGTFELEHWCEKVGLQYGQFDDKTKAGVIGLLGHRDEIIESAIMAKINPFLGDELIHSDEKNFMNSIVKLKYCIYEGYKTNIATFEDASYHLLNGFEIAIPKSLALDEANAESLKKKGIGYVDRPKKIMFDKITIVENKKLLTYELQAGKVSILDGYIPLGM